MSKDGGRTAGNAASKGAAVQIDPYRSIVFPNRVREERQDAGYAKLLPFAAKIPEIPYIRLSKIERGEVVPRPEELRLVARALGMAPERLLIDIDAGGFSIEHWAEPFGDMAAVDDDEERFAVKLAAALRAHRAADPALTIQALEQDYHLPPVNLSRVENAQRTFGRWSGATRAALFALFGASDEAVLRDAIEAQYRAGTLNAYLPLIANPAIREERTRARIAELAAALVMEGGRPARPKAAPEATAPAAAPAAPAADAGRVVPVHGGPLTRGLIADAPTGASAVLPPDAGPRAFALRLDRAPLGGGLPAQSILFADPDRFPVPGGLAVLREKEGWRLLAVASGRDGRMTGYSINPEIEISVDECDPAELASVIGAAFP